MLTVEEVAEKCISVCIHHRWERNWSNGGCYLHLEVSEFIESLRGKGDSSPAAEAGDVLFVLLSMLKAHNIDIQEVLFILNERCDGLLETPSLQREPLCSLSGAEPWQVVEATEGRR